MPVQRKNRTTGKKEWYARVILPDGKRIERKVRENTKKDAQKLEFLIEEELKNVSPGSTGIPSLYELFSRHLDHVQVRYAKKSYNEKHKVFKDFLKRFSPKTPVTDITYGNMEDFLNSIAKKVSGARANKYRIHLVRAYNWGIRALHLPEPNPWKVERYREEKTPRYVPSEEDFWKVYAQGTEQEKLMLLIAIDTLARKSEILSLTWSDVDFESSKRQPYGRVRLWTNKRDGGREYDWLPLTERVRDGLREQRYQTGLKEWVFINPETQTRYTWLSEMVQRLCREVNVPVFGFHAIRHLGACLLDEEGEPLAFITAMLRHRNAQTTSIYLRSLAGTRIRRSHDKGDKGSLANSHVYPDNDSECSLRTVL